MLAANTLLTKWQDQVCVKNCDAVDPSQRGYFEQPVIQTYVYEMIFCISKIS